MPNGVSQEPIEAVLFDVDGTLVDSVGGLVLGLSDTFAHYGNPRTHEEIRALIGVPLVHQMKLAIGDAATESQIQAGIDFTIERYAFHQAGTVMFEESIEALRLLSGSGLRIALVTSKNAAEMNAFWPKFPARDSVDAVVCASDVEHPKPHPESAFEACRRLQADPSRTMMVGDSIYDIRCAKAAGVAAIAVSYGSTDARTLLREHPDGLFESPSALLAWVRESIFYSHEEETDSGQRRTRQDDRIVREA